MRIPQHIASAIEQAQAGLRDEPRFHIEAVAKRLGGVPLYGDMGGTIVLLADGAVVEVADGADGDQAAPAAPERITLGLVAGSRRYPWLAELIPPRPDDAAQCEPCGGRGELAFADASGQPIAVWCGRCHGLGWQRLPS